MSEDLIEKARYLINAFECCADPADYYRDIAEWRQEAQQAQGVPRLNYVPLHEFAELHGVDYNKLCAAVRAAIAAQAPQQAQAPGWQRSQHDADSAELRSLCKARDEARRERDMLRAELAGHEASSGHLSAMVDELRALLSEAMAMMKALHESALPDDGPEMNAIVPAGAFHQFVDANAVLIHKIHISPHGDRSTAPQQGSKS